MSERLTQKQKVLKTLEAVRSGDHNIDEQYLFRHDGGDGVSSRFFKQVMFLSEVNARVHELQEDGFKIVSSKTHKDPFGFVYYRLEN